MVKPLEFKLRAAAFTILLASGLVQFVTAQQAPPQGRGQNVKPGATASNAPAIQRIALVIGNGAYQETPLANPVNDANDMELTLRELGFTVLKATNANLQTMEALINEFGEKLRGSSVALFFFAGHGLQVDGENYLVPVGAVIGKQADVKYATVHVGKVLDQLGDDPQRANIIILDACRNNPFRSFRSLNGGLAPLDAPAGSLIAYATAPGKVASDGSGRNGLYTGELLKQMRVPGQSLSDVLMQTGNSVRERSNGVQVPWQASSLTRHVYLKGQPAAGSAPAQLTADQALWNVTQYSTNPQDFNDFLQKYPQSNLAEAARLKLRQLTDAANQLAAANAANQRGWVPVADQRIPVAANEAWTDTLIQVKRDQELWIRVTGQANLGSFGTSGPDGILRNDAKRPAANCQTGALLARIGTEIVCLGADVRFKANADGRLALGINESNVADNSGSLIAKIVINELR